MTVRGLVCQQHGVPALWGNQVPIVYCKVVNQWCCCFREYGLVNVGFSTEEATRLRTRTSILRYFRIHNTHTWTGLSSLGQQAGGSKLGYAGATARELAWQIASWALGTHCHLVSSLAFLALRPAPKRPLRFSSSNISSIANCDL